MNELNKISACKLISLIRSKQVSCVEVAYAYLDRIAVVNPTLNAIVQQVDPSEVLKQAAEADAKVASGSPLGKLHGIPVTIKDSHWVKGLVGSCGCVGLQKLGTEDATLVARYRQEGAIILGITNVPELLMAFETDNSLYGRTLNPYNFERTTGGSSGGEAAILAAGGSALGFGSDAGGSIRVPAHNCGIAGLKPTLGLLPTSTGSILGECPGIFGMLVTAGPMARFVEDLILALPILAGPNGRDPDTLPIPVGDPSKVNLKSLRIAYYTDDGFSTASMNTIKTVLQAADSLRDYTKNVTEARPSPLSISFRLVSETLALGGDGGEGLMGYLNHIGVMTPSPLLQGFLDAAKEVRFSVTDLRSRLNEIDYFRSQMLRFLDDYDVIICPVAATPAKLHGTSNAEVKDHSYTMAYNLARWPAAVVRCGTSADGLPIGVQIVAAPWKDHVALAVAAHLERQLGGWQPSQN